MKEKRAILDRHLYAFFADRCVLRVGRVISAGTTHIKVRTECLTTEQGEVYTRYVDRVSVRAWFEDKFHVGHGDDFAHAQTMLVLRYAKVLRHPLKKHEAPV